MTSDEFHQSRYRSRVAAGHMPASPADERPQNFVEHRVESGAQVLGQEAQHEIAMLLQQDILSAVSQVRFTVLFL